MKIINVEYDLKTWISPFAEYTNGEKDAILNIWKRLGREYNIGSLRLSQYLAYMFNGLPWLYRKLFELFFGTVEYCSMSQKDYFATLNNQYSKVSDLTLAEIGILDAYEDGKQIEFTFDDNQDFWVTIEWEPNEKNVQHLEDMIRSGMYKIRVKQ